VQLRVNTPVHSHNPSLPEEVPFFASSGFFFSSFDGWHYPFRRIFLSVGFFCAVLHHFAYQGFIRPAVALHPCLIRLPTRCRRH
jgi:hypothetical protein